MLYWLRQSFEFDKNRRIIFVDGLDINGSSSANNDYLASFHTGRITKKLIEMGEKQLIDK